MAEKFDLYFITGNLGTGKTTAGEKLKDRLGVKLYDPDLMRRAMSIQEYRPEDTPRVMEAIWKEIGHEISEGRSAILCTPHVQRLAREWAYERMRSLSAETRRGLQMVLIRCECSEATAKARIIQRPAADGLHLPSNDPESYDRIQRVDNPIDVSEMVENPTVSFLLMETEKNRLEKLAVRKGDQRKVRVIEDILIKKIKKG